MNVLVIDIGTSSMRGILFSERGNPLLQKQVKYQPVHRSKVWIEQSADDWRASLESIAGGIAELAAKSNLSIDAVSVTAQRSSIIPIGGQGEALMPAIMWQDSRNEEICLGLKPENELIFRCSGASVNTVFSGGKMAWVRENRPDIYEKVKKFVNVPEYVILLMTGELCTDYTYGSRTNLMNLKTRTWDPDLLRLFGVEKEKLCTLQEPGSICGQITREFGEKTGIRAGIPVISAGGDQQCAAVGQGVFKEGMLSVVTGTGAFLVSACDQVPESLDTRLICNCAAVKGQYILEASMLTCCSAFDWYCNNFYSGTQIEYDRINQELEDSYDSLDESIVLPYFQGRGSADWNSGAKAHFANITLSTRRQDILKALVEGIFMEIQNNIEVIKQYVQIPYAFISGGMTKGRILNQMQSDIYGMKLIHMKNSESTALGALMVTLTQLGKYKTIEEAFNRIRSDEKVDVYEANKRKQDEYQKKLSQLNGLYEKIYG